MIMKKKKRMLENIKNYKIYKKRLLYRIKKDQDQLLRQFKYPIVLNLQKEIFHLMIKSLANFF